jgi:hypothetical protein
VKKSKKKGIVEQVGRVVSFRENELYESRRDGDYKPEPEECSACGRLGWDGDWEGI